MSLELHKNSVAKLGMSELEVIPPVAPSPLDSMRGRGKSSGLSHSKHSSSLKNQSKNKPIVILILPENRSKHIIGYKNGTKL